MAGLRGIQARSIPRYGRNGNAVLSQAMRTEPTDADDFRRAIANDAGPRAPARALIEIRRSILLNLRLRFDSGNCFRNLK
jgi:hypothetical protein